MTPINSMKFIFEILNSQYFTVIFTAFSTWKLKDVFDKFWRIKPKLYVSVSQPLFSQRNNQNIFFLFGWRQTISIKNNSKYTAYNIQIHFPEGCNLSDNQPISNFLKENNHLESNQELKFEVESIKRITAEEYLNFKIEEDGARLISFGVKNKDPKVSLMPEKVKKIKLYLKYKNDRGASFFTKFTKENNHEINCLKIFKPKL